MPWPTTVIRGDTIRGEYANAAAVMATLGQAGIDYDDVVYQLEHDGLTTFQASWAALAETLQRKLAVTRRDDRNEDDSERLPGPGESSSH